jgi:hypothetical protein
MRYVNWYFILIIYLICFVFYSLISPFFWFDEAGQIFMSLGLNHFTLPNSKIGSLSDVILNNNRFNLDPGGFTFLLYFWLKVSTKYIWLRILPYIFFIASIFLIIEISKIVGKNSIIYGLLIFIIKQLVVRSNEIRAYTMEFLSILISIYIIINLKKINNKKLFNLSILSSLLISSRYSSTILFGIISLITITYLIRTSKSNYEKLKSILLFLAPLATSVYFIIFVTLINQNPSLSKVSYMEYLSDNPFLLFRNINCIHSISIIILLLIYCFDKKIVDQLKTLIFTSLIVNFVFICISLLGLYPYSPFNERNLAIFTYTFLPLIYWIHISFFQNLKFSNNLIIPLIFGIIYTYSFNKILYHNWRKNNLYTDLLDYKFSNNNNIFFIEKDDMPSTKYLFEFYYENSHLNYPKSFITLDNNFIKFEKNIYNSDTNYFLISSRNIDDDKIEKIGSNLYKIDAK